MAKIGGNSGRARLDCLSVVQEPSLLQSGAVSDFWMEGGQGPPLRICRIRLGERISDVVGNAIVIEQGGYCSVIPLQSEFRICMPSTREIIAPCTS
jgi:hypothetical protein